jgi:hypothetical protein
VSTFKNGLLGAAAIAALVSFGTSAHALTYNYVEASGGSCCAVDTKNTVQVSNTTLPNGSTALAAGVFDILVTLDTSTTTHWAFQKNAGDKTTGHAASFAFSSSLTTITIPSASITSPFFANTNNVMGAYSMSPFSFPANGYGVSQNTSNGVYSTLDFHVVTGTTDTLAQFIATLLAETSNSNLLFAADVQDGSTAGTPTGVIGFAFNNITNGGNQGTTPLPAALPLFASGLGGLGLLGWRRKRKAAALAA